MRSGRCHNRFLWFHKLTSLPSTFLFHLFVPFTLQNKLDVQYVGDFGTISLLATLELLGAMYLRPHHCTPLCWVVFRHCIPCTWIIIALRLWHWLDAKFNCRFLLLALDISMTSCPFAPLHVRVYSRVQPLFQFIGLRGHCWIVIWRCPYLTLQEHQTLYKITV